MPKYLFDEFKNKIDIGGGGVITNIEVPMQLPDGSILFYDRGSAYGEYSAVGSDIVRISDGVDDGSAESTYWRYLICDQHDLDNGTFQWGPYGTNEGMTDVKYEDMGYGLPNTNAMIAKYATNTSYWWRLIKEKRDNTGLDWFMPSKDELDMMYDNRTVITGQGGDAFKTDTYYWSSSEAVATTLGPSTSPMAVSTTTTRITRTVAVCSGESNYLRWLAPCGSRGTESHRIEMRRNKEYNYGDERIPA